jgi:hypothetical protein
MLPFFDPSHLKKRKEKKRENDSKRKRANCKQTEAKHGKMQNCVRNILVPELTAIRQRQDAWRVRTTRQKSDSEKTGQKRALSRVCAGKQIANKLKPGMARCKIV